MADEISKEAQTHVYFEEYNFINTKIGRIYIVDISRR